MIYIFYLPSINLMSYSTEVQSDVNLEPIHVFDNGEEYTDYMESKYGHDEFSVPTIGVCGMTLNSDIEGLKSNRTLPAYKNELKESDNVTEVLVFNTEYEVRLDDYLYDEFYRPFLEYIKTERRDSLIDDIL